MVKKPINVSFAFLLLISPESKAWIPCMPICDAACSVLTMAIQTAQHLPKIFDLQIAVRNMEFQANKLEEAYKDHGEDIDSSWEDATEDLKKRLITSGMFSLSYTDAMTDRFGGMANVFQSSAATLGSAKQLNTNATMNTISESIKKGVNAYYSGINSHQSTLTLDDTYQNYISGKTYVNKKKQTNYDNALFNASKNFVGLNQFNTPLLKTAEMNAKAGVSDKILGINTKEFDARSDPYFAGVDSIPFRRGIIDLQSNRFLASDSSKQQVSINFKKKTDMNGLYLSNRNLKNLLRLDSLNSTFRSSLTSNLKQ